MSATPPDTGEIDLEELAEWLVERRWFGSKTRELTRVGVIDMPLLDPGPPPAYKVRDLLDDQVYDWSIGRNYVRLAPGNRMAHVMRVER